MRKTFEFTYDAESDAAYIGLATDFGGRRKTMETGDPAVLADVVDGKIVALEVLGARNHPLTRHLLPQGSPPDGLTVAKAFFSLG